MQEISTEKKNSINILRSDERTVDRLSLKYTFYRIAIKGMREQYAMSVICEETESFVALGDSETFAMSVYSDMHLGAVTPTNLWECIEDKIKAEYLYL